MRVIDRVIDTLPVGTFEKGRCRLELGVALRQGELAVYVKRLKNDPRKEKIVGFALRGDRRRVLQLLRLAAKLEPSRSNRIPVAMIATKLGTIFGEIGPYWYSWESAVFLRQNGQGVAVEHAYAAEFAQWLAKRLAEVQKASGFFTMLLQ